MMRATDLLFITISHSVSLMGKTWWMLMLLLRLLVVLLAGFTLFSDEQERFICNTIQPGCSNVCFDVFAPVSVLRLWFFHLILLCLPHALFATYVVHKQLTYPNFGALRRNSSRGGSLDNSSSSRELSLHKAPLQDLPREWGAPRFLCAYTFAVLLRILLEAVFGAGQFYLFGLSVPKSFLCFEAPCTSGVECYISRPTEKTLMLDFMLGVALLSILLSFLDLVSTAKASVRWRRKREMLMDEMSRGEQSSTFTTTTVTEDSDVLSTRRISPGRSSVDAVKDEKPNQQIDEPTLLNENSGPSRKTTSSTNDRIQENKDPKADVPRSPTPMSNPAPTHFVLHGHLRPPLSPRADRGPPLIPRMQTPMGVRQPDMSGPVKSNSSQQLDSSDSQDKRAWV